MTRGSHRAVLSVALVLGASLSGVVPAHAATSLTSYPASLNFGSTQVNTVSDFQQVQVYSAGNGPAVTISAVVLAGAAASQYTIEQDLCSGETLDSLSPSCTIGLRFAPNSTGPKTARIDIVANDGTLGIPLDGTGTPPSLSLYPSSAPFGSIEVGGLSSVQTFSVYNAGIGQGPVTIGLVSIIGANAGDFLLAHDGCSSRTLDAFEQCTIDARFAPSAVGDKSASISFTSTAIESPHVLHLSGNAHLAVSMYPGSASFGSVNVGASSFPVDFSLYSSSSEIVSVLGVAVTGANAADFDILDGCSGQQLTQYSSGCMISTTFEPASRGNKSATLTVTTSAPGGSTTATLLGTGVGPSLSATPTSLSFGNTQLGASGHRTVTIRNTGDGDGVLHDATIQGTHPEDFSMSVDCSGAWLPPQGACASDVAFEPTGMGLREATLVVTTDGATISVPLRGTGIDTTPPQTAIDEAVVPVKASLLTSVTGTATDAGGVDGTTIVFEDALGNRTTAQAALDACGSGNRSCGWSLVVPILPPGPYTVRAFSRDRNANVETPGDTATLLIV
jgi:hypothetical protein